MCFRCVELILNNSEIMVHFNDAWRYIVFLLRESKRI
jgi:hypothetical protein